MATLNPTLSVSLPTRLWPDKDPEHIVGLGRIFADKRYTTLTPEHGFSAHARPFLELPQGRHNGDPNIRGNASRFRRFERIKRKEREFLELESKPVRCIIDESTDCSFAKESAFGMGTSPISPEEQETWIATLGHFVIPGTWLRYFLDMDLVINGCSYFVQAWVVEELFPGNEDVGIQVVLGRDFLRYYPGFTLKPVLRGNAIDLVPYNYEPGGEDFEITSEGELLVYVCGHSEIRVDDVKKGTQMEHGGFGVFYGPDSKYNMSMHGSTEGTPQSDICVFEGIVCGLFLPIMGRLIYGRHTFTSVKILTDAQAIVDTLRLGGKLPGYRARGWINKKGKKHALWKLFETWAGYYIPEMFQDWSPWMKRAMIDFEKVEKKEKGLLAARHLAQSAVDSSIMQKVDRGIPYLVKRREWMGYIFTCLPRGSRGFVFVRHREESYLRNMKLASDKAPHTKTKTHVEEAQSYTSRFFPTQSIIGIYPFWRALDKDRTFNACDILGMLDTNFAERVVEIAKQKGKLKDSVEFVSLENRTVRMFGGDSGSDGDDSSDDDPGNGEAYTRCYDDPAVLELGPIVGKGKGVHREDSENTGGGGNDLFMNSVDDGYGPSGESKGKEKGYV